MKTFFAISLVASCLCMAQAAQADEVDTPIYQYTCNHGIYDLCGYYDRATHKRGDPLEWLIPPKFEEASPFKDGLAAVKLNGKSGFINYAGEFEIKPKYDVVGSFHKGLAPFKIDGWIGFINKRGEIVVPAKFSRAIILNESTIIGSDNPNYKLYSRFAPGGNQLNSGIQSGLYDLKKGWLTDQKYYFGAFRNKDDDLVWAKERRGKTGLMRTDGSWFQEPKYVRTAPLKDGLAIVTVEQDDGTELSGAINEKGEVVIPPKFERLNGWNKGLAVVTVEQNDGTKLWGAIDKKGKVVVPIKFEWLGRWMGDYARTRIGDYNSKQVGLVDRDGNLLGGQYFEEIRLPDNYFTATETVFLPRVKADGVWYSLTLEGKLIEDQKKMDEIAKGSILSCENFTLVRTEDGLRAINKTGQTIVDFDYPQFFSFYVGPHSVNSAMTCDSPLSISRDGKYSFLLPEGTFFAGQFFDNALPIFENVAGFSVDKKWGLIDASGKVIVEPTYDKIRWAGDGQFQLTKGETGYLFDKDGTRYNLEDDPDYNQEFKTKLPPRENYLRCSGSALKYKNEKWGMVSDDGEIILPFKYKALTCYESGVAWAPREDLKKWCPIDRHGKFLPKDKCETKINRARWSHYFPEKLADNEYDSSVLWNVQYLSYGDGRASAPPIMSPDGVSANRPRLMTPTHSRR